MKTSSMEDRFWAKVDKRTDAECWEWQASKWDGYGSFGVGNKKVTRAHRVSWVVTHGAIPDGMQVLHKCDNRACVNPSHLFLGTHEDNHKDKVAKGRQHRPTGEKNPQHGKTGSQATCYGRAGAQHPMYGRHHSEATKLKMSMSHKNR